MTVSSAIASMEDIAEPVHTIGIALADLSSASERPGSRIARSTVDYTLRDDWAQRPLLESYSHARLLVNHAADHFLGVAACIRAERIIYSPHTLVRSGLESAARAYYLLDPDIDTRERVRRWLNEKLESLTEELSMAAGLGPVADQAAAATQDQIDEIRGGAPRWQFTVTGSAKPDKNGFFHAPFLGSKPPSAMTRAEALIDRGDGSGMARTVVRQASAVVHAQSHGLMAFMLRDEAVDHTTPGMSVVPFGVEAHYLARRLSPVPVATFLLAERLLGALGGDMSEWRDLVVPIGQQWSAWIRASDSEPTPASP